MEKKSDRNRGKGDSGRCTKQRSKKNYSRKRRNPNKGKKLSPKVDDAGVDQGNDRLDQNVENQNIGTPCVPTCSTVSSEKIEEIVINENEQSDSISGFRFVEMNILSNVLSLLACPSCFNSCCLNLYDVATKKKDFQAIFKLNVVNVISYMSFTPPQKSFLAKTKGGEGCILWKLMPERCMVSEALVLVMHHYQSYVAS